MELHIRINRDNNIYIESRHIKKKVIKTTITTVINRDKRNIEIQ